MEFSQSLLYLLLLLFAFSVFAFSVSKLIKGLNHGKPENRFDQIGRRISNTLWIALGQSKILREPIAGLLHLLVFWGFIILAIGLIEEILKGILRDFSEVSFNFLGPVYSAISFTQDLFAFLVLLAVIFLLFRRWVIRPARLWTSEMKMKGHLDATLILTLILFVVITYFLQYAYLFNMHGGQFVEWESRPFTIIVAGWVSDSSQGYYVNWWAHMIVVLAFLNYLPYSKHLHVLTSVFNVYFARLEPLAKLSGLKIMETMEKMDENPDMDIPEFGAKDVNDLTWKQLFDSYTCTECGRCTAVCPANLTGKSLSPRKIIVDTRAR